MRSSPGRGRPSSLVELGFWDALSAREYHKKIGNGGAASLCHRLLSLGPSDRKNPRGWGGQPRGHSEWNLMFSLWVFNLQLLKCCDHMAMDRLPGEFSSSPVR